jgi:hypothetical protein
MLSTVFRGYALVAIYRLEETRAPLSPRADGGKVARFRDAGSTATWTASEHRVQSVADSDAVWCHIPPALKNCILVSFGLLRGAAR